MTNLIQFRLPPYLLTQLARRTDGRSPGQLAVRDLDRYYRLLEHDRPPLPRQCWFALLRTLEPEALASLAQAFTAAGPLDDPPDLYHAYIKPSFPAEPPVLDALAYFTWPEIMATIDTIERLRLFPPGTSWDDRFNALHIPED
jgi:hypothetical protein